MYIYREIYEDQQVLLGASYDFCRPLLSDIFAGRAGPPTIVKYPNNGNTLVVGKLQRCVGPDAHCVAAALNIS